MQLSFDANFQQFQRGMTDVAQRQLPFAMMMALNDTAVEGLESNKKLMRRVFDRPTRWTLNAFRVQRATKRKLVAKVERKSMVGRRFYLEVQQKGGPRRQTGLERVLTSNLAYAGNFRTVLPTKNTRLNQHGNMTPATINKMLSAVRAQSDRAQNASAASKKRNRGREQYFVPGLSSRLSPGIWQRKSKKIKKVLSFSADVPTYRKKFRFDENLRRVEGRAFPKHFAKRMKAAIATAR